MKVRIGSLEIIDPTPEELDELVKRYGSLSFDGDKAEQHQGSAHRRHSQQPPQDIVVLKKFVDGGAEGVTTTDLGEILGRRGKATRGAAKEWARRIGLTTDDNMEVFEESRIGTQRGIRLKPSLIEVAKELMKSRQ